MGKQPSETDSQFHPPDYASQQVDAVAALTRNILSRYPEITPTHVLGHSDIAYARKSDPGPRFPWHELYLKGVKGSGLLVRGRHDAALSKNEFASSGLPSTAQLLAAFRR
ncbi:N-acetylmuramoyl-L-alanine amidase [Dyella choica]|uniref:N-acetylmuramoyl-L-alanine amidase n=1 Tax=Dyella choica TaxID=1927959 RepID=A0A3S0S0I8_9GAMM|nr:N-acetylmuramoyl-L-alanine amidase [Dyella choica]RUL76020.1 hypothetical protein EKH80_09890 [Dyella choica]